MATPAQEGVAVFVHASERAASRRLKLGWKARRQLFVADGDRSWYDKRATVRGRLERIGAKLARMILRPAAWG